MAIGEVIKQARLQLGITQEQAGGIAFVSSKTISSYECGRRSIAAEVLGVLVRQLDNPRLTMEAAAEITGGAYCTPWLDGDGVDLHRTSVWAKALEELQEAVSAVGATRVANRPQRATETELAQVRESLMQVLDARVAIDHYVAIICQEYGISISATYRAHREKLENRGYVQKQKKTAHRGAAR